MTNRLLLMLPTLILAAAVIPAVIRAAEEPKPAPKVIRDHMELLNDNYKLLRKAARKKEFNEKSIEQAGGMIDNAKLARELEPPMAAKLTGAEKKKFIEEYKARIDEMIKTFEELKKLLEEKKNDDAAKLIDTFDEIKKKGHEKFVEE